MASVPHQVVLVIADISGYTRFMVANAKTLAHAQAIITELLEAILHEVDVPLRVAKLEGDAVFMYAARSGDDSDSSWEAARRTIGGKLPVFFDAFAATVARLSSVQVCSCTACSSVRALRLKAIVHAGEAIVHDVGPFQELAGVDVIIAHRLLKNSVEGSDYILMTEAAHRELGTPSVSLQSVLSTETYDDVGEIRVHVFRRAATEVMRPAPRRQRSAIRWMWTLLWRSIARLSRPDPAYQNIPTRPARGRMHALVFFLVLAPLVMVVRTIAMLLPPTWRVQRDAPGGKVR